MARKQNADLSMRIGEENREAIDRIAAEQDRSISWVVRAALAAYIAERDPAQQSGSVMDGYTDELAEEIARRNAIVAEVVARHQGDAPVVMGGPCSSSGYCGCRCKPCLGGRHQCGHRNGCHKNCSSR